MKNKIGIICTILVLAALAFTGCSKQGPAGPAGPDSVINSNWIEPASWTGTSGDWYFDVSAPSLTQNIVENGVVLGYTWLVGDLYNATTERPLPAYAVGANWSFLIYKYGDIQFDCDAAISPSVSNRFRYVAIPPSMLDLSSAKSSVSIKTFRGMSESQLKSMSYDEVIKILNIPK